MPRLRFLLALAVLVAAAVFTARDQWPWPRPIIQAPAVVAEIFTETLDTLRLGETVSELFSRQGVKGFMLASEVDRSIFDLRRLRAGLVFNFRKKLTDSLPSQVVVRTGPEQKVNLQLAADGWRAVAEPIVWQPEMFALEGPIDNSLYDNITGYDVGLNLRPTPNVVLKLMYTYAMSRGSGLLGNTNIDVFTSQIAWVF